MRVLGESQDAEEVKRLTVGVIGHVDHGKTALVRALTGIETDRLAEEKARGISIALGFAHFTGAGGEVIDLIDMPGHERFVRTMAAGAGGIDAVLLVVAANEGVKPQTVEHVEIAALLGVRQALVAVTKCDLVSPGETALVAAEAMELLAGNGFGHTPPSRLREGDFLAHLTSASSGQGIDQLRVSLARIARTRQTAQGQPWLPIDRAFTLPGHGPVVTGTLRGGELSAGDRLDLLPSRRAVRFRALQVHGAAVERASPGQRVAVNLRGAEIGELARGMALSAPGALAGSPWLTLAIRSTASAPPLRNGMRLRALAGTGEFGVRLRLLESDVLEPGVTALAQLHCERDVALPARCPVVLRRHSPAQTVAGGEVLEPETRRLRRRDAAVLARLARLRDGSPKELVEQAALAGATLQALARLSALAPARIGELLAALPVTITREGLVLPHAEAERRQRLKPRPDPARLAAAEELAAQIAGEMLAAGLTPPLPKELTADPLRRAAIERLLREGVLLRCQDRDKGKEMLFHRDAIAGAKVLLAPLLGSGLTVSQIAAVLGISRKFCMPLLDHLDGCGFTMRAGELRLPGT